MQISRIVPFARRIPNRVLGNWDSGLKENYGFAFAVAWYLSLFVGVLFPESQSDSLVTNAWKILIASTAVGGAFAAFAGFLDVRSSHEQRFVIVASGILGSASLTIIALCAKGLATPDLFLVGVATGGFAYSLTISSWMQKFAAEGVVLTARNYLVCAAFGACLFFFVDAVLREYAPFAFAAFPMASCFAIHHATSRTNDPDPSEYPTSSAYGVARLYGVLALASFSYGLLHFQAFGPNAVFPSAELTSAALFEVLTCALATIVVSLVRTSKTPVAFYLIISLICASTLCMLFAHSRPSEIACYHAAMVGYRLSYFMALFRIVELGGKKRGVFATLFGGVLVVQHACQLAGLFLGSTLSSGSTVTIVVLTCMVVAALIVTGNPANFEFSTAGVRADKADTIRTVSARFGLTPREMEILELWGSGHTSNYIEQQLHIAKSTVKTHLTHIYRKTGTSSKEELLLLIDATDRPAR